MTDNKVKCHTCNEKTNTTSPITIKRQSEMGFCVIGLCSKCLKPKSKFLSNNAVRHLPKEILDMPIRSTVIEYIEDEEKNMIKIFPLIENTIN